MTKRVIDQYHNKSATEHLVNGSIVALVGTVFVVIASFLLKVVVARGVGSHGYGTLLLGLSIVMILSKFSSFAFNTTLSRQIPYHIEDKYKIKHFIFIAILVVLPFSLFINTSLFYFSKPLSELFLHDIKLSPMLEVMSFLVPLYALIEILNGILRGFNKIKHLILLVRILPNVLLLIAVSFVLYFNGNLNQVSKVYVVTTLITVVIAIVYVRHFIKVFLQQNTQTKKKLSSDSGNHKTFSFAFPVWISQTIGMLRGKVDILLLGVMSTVQQAGEYGVAIALSRLLVITMTVVNSVYLPILTREYKKSGIENVGLLYKVVARWQFYLATPLLFLLLYDGRLIIELVFGREYVDAYFSLIILSLAIYLNSIAGVFGETLNAVGKPIFNTYISISSLTIIVVACFIAIPLMGMDGAAIASGISLLVATILGLFFLYRFTGITPLRPGLITDLLLIMISFLIYKSVNGLLPESIQPFFLLLAFPLYYWICFTMLSLFGSIEQHELNSIRSKMLKFNLHRIFPVKVWEKW
jgi:O-antigen/teichoic acid export membrane protein